MNIQDKMQRYMDNYAKKNQQVVDILKPSLSQKEYQSMLNVALNSTPSKHPSTIRTLDNKNRPLSQQLKQRFEFCDRLEDDVEILLGIDDIKDMISHEKFLSWFTVMKQEWINCAPQLFAPSQLSIFAVGDEMSDYSLLVWKELRIEPELWCYSGQHEQIFTDLNEYWDWRNEQ